MWLSLTRLFVSQILYEQSKDDSPWSRPQPCFWPVDPENTRICALGSSSGLHQCVHGTHRLPESEWRWCGSNYDALGNPRFLGSDGESMPFFNQTLSKMRVMNIGEYEEDVNWGLTGFDSFPRAVVTIFQIITLEGWTTIMYQAMDAYGPSWSFFFCSIVFVGSFFVLNLVLAVLEHAFTTSRDKDLALQLKRQLQESTEHAKEVRCPNNECYHRK